MADTQFTILGMSGSGKSCYLLGLYDQMASGSSGYTISEMDEEKNIELLDEIRRLHDYTLKRDRFPAGTDRVTTYHFNLQYGFESILTFDWKDYPGGLLVKRNSENSEDYETISKAINESSCLIICVDGSLLIGGDNREKVTNIRNNCSNVINAYFNKYFSKNLKLPPTVIMITKYDMCRNDVGSEDIVDIIQDAFSPFFVERGTRKIVAILPATLGVDIMDDDCTGKMVPYNLHLPVFMGVWFALDAKIKQYAAEIFEREKEYEMGIAMYKAKKEKEESWIFKNHKRIALYAHQLKKLENSRNAEIPEKRRTLGTMRINSESMLAELNKIPTLFVNGKGTTFSEVVEKEEEH